MKLKKWLKYMDPIVDVTIFTDKTPPDAPAFSGPLFDLPKKYKKMKIGRAEFDDSGEEPIFITHFTNEHGVICENITINLIE